MTSAPGRTHASYEIGQWVRSIPVGKAPAFAGQIVEYICKPDRRSRDFNKFYVVRDAEKRRFARTAGELEPLQ